MLHLPNIPQFAVCYLAVLKSGAIAVAVNAILKREEVKFILNDSGAKVLFTVGDLLPSVPERGDAGDGDLACGRTRRSASSEQIGRGSRKCQGAGGATGDRKCRRRAL